MCWKCKLCSLMFKVWHSDRGYYYMTELFVFLHRGKDYCKEAQDFATMC